MRAVVFDHFGPPEVLRLREIPKPTPRDREILVRVRATTVTAADWRCRSKIVPPGFGLIVGFVLGFSKPKFPILGTQLSGEIEAVGSGVTKFKVGDAVFAFSALTMGCHVEYKCLPEDGAVVLKPPGLSHEEAASLSFGGTTALGFFRKAGLKAGDRVLVNGASGDVGTAAVQLARHFGAVVTGVCSTANVALVKSLGADAVIDYTREDFTKRGQTWDLIVDNAGTAPWARSRGSLAEGGRLLLVLGSIPDMLRTPWVALSGRKRIIPAGPWNVDDLRLLADLAAAGKYRPVIDRSYPLDQIVEAHRYVDAGHKKGSVVIVV
jgi:NADPH:quinone reductase-like Zn-dependent oxidoreductase